MFATIFIINVFVLLHVYKNKMLAKEHFTVDTEEKVDKGDSNEVKDTTSLKQFIFKTFDNVHQRNPTNEELDKYMTMNDRNAIKAEISGESIVKSQPVVIDETSSPVVEEQPKSKNLMESALLSTTRTIETLNSNITLSKSFVHEKINNIQKQLDDLKLLL